MKIQYMSDLHLEYADNRQYLSENPVQKKGDILVLAGDIVNDVKREEIKPFFENLQSQFKFIISTMGNHEFHYEDIDYAYPSYKKYLSDNHLLINNDVFIIENTKFIVSILWSEIDLNKRSEIEDFFEDYQVIKKDKKLITIEDTNYYHHMSKQFLENELKKDFAGKVVVITHHVPSYQCLISKYKDTPVESAFASNLNYLIENNNIDCWIFGHQHTSFEGFIGKTRMVSNPLGGHKENFKSFNLGKFIEI